MQSIKINQFNLETTLASGQCFGWKKIDGWFYGEIDGKPIKLKQEKNRLLFIGSSEEEVRNYFALDENVGSIYKRISKNDPILKKAVTEFNGLRILRQDPWESAVSFVCSAFSNIPRIEKKLSRLRNTYGKQVSFERNSFYLFPKPEALAKASMKDLRACGLGFRDKYVKALGQRMSKFDISKLKKKSYAEAKTSLIKSAGIGEKVADCICLFSLDKHEAFPIDVWIARAMKEYYSTQIRKMFPKTKFSYKDIQEFARRKWGKDTGYAQQFLYEYSRKHLKK